ncbi:hypothetical protein LCGC14_1447030 [marine sediment metagenome]|uniref:Right handed beta helix domain-containing protein n=1 Tax=marine sediment metagenome TaxID=412755 RepID=A0A0F9LZG2_9ZZZZ
MATSIIDPDNGGGTDYLSLNAWEAAKQAVLSAPEIAQCRNSSGSADTTAFEISAWTTSAENYILIEAYTGFQHEGVYSTAKYHLTTTNDSALHILEHYVRVDGIQIELTTTGTAGASGVAMSGLVAGGADIRLSNIIVKGICASTGTVAGIVANDADLTLLTIWNTIVYGIEASGDPSQRGIYMDNVGTANLYNCTVNDCERGIERDVGTVNVQNSLVFECADDFNGTFNSITYCASDDDHTGDSATNFVITQTADDYAALVTDADGRDYSVTDTSSELFNTGNGATPKGTFTDDIIGTTRGPADGDWDIGAFEFAAEGPAAHVATITDGISAADVHAGLGGYLATITDGLGMADAHSSGLQALLSEGMLNSDVASVVSALFATLTDGVNTSDQPSPLKGMVATLSESVNVGDTLDPLLALLAEISDGVDFGDVPSILSQFLDTITDGITAGDAPDPLLALLAEISEGVDLGDFTSTFSQFLDSLADGVDFGDVNNAIGGYIKSISDGVTTSDTVSPLLALLAAVSDGGVFGDVAGTINQFLDVIADSIIISDVNSPNVVFNVTVTDSASFNDVLSTIFSFGVIITDGFSTGDVTVYPSGAQGEVNISFSTKKSTVTFAVRKASLTFISKQSNIEFQRG